RNDQVALDLRMWLRDSMKQLAIQSATLAAHFVNLAERSSEVVMPSFTHLQRAQPVIAGAEALAWASFLYSDAVRIHALDDPNEIPLGSGAIAGSSLQIDPSIT